jgi:hypothetical protein
MKEVKKENKFFVLKKADMDEFMERYQKGLFMDEEGTAIQDAINKLVDGIGDMREQQGKPRFNAYVVCNQDEPYAEKVWQVILEGERSKVKQQ